MDPLTPDVDPAAQQVPAAPPAAAPAAPPAAAPTDPAATAPAAPSTLGAPAQAAPTATPTATPAAPAEDSGSGISGIMGSVLDLLHNRDNPQVSRDANGNRVVTQGKPLTRGEQIAQIALTALKGATTAAAAKPGPGHLGAGLSAAVSQAIGDQQGAAHAKEDAADHNFEVQQKAKLDNLNYQLLSRKLVSDEFDLQNKQVKAGQETINFSNTLLDREKGLGSYDLGTYKDERQIPNVMAKQPQFMQKLYKEQGIIAVPVFGADGQRNGVQLFERKPDVNAQLAPEGAVAHRWVLGNKPGEGPSLQTFSPVGATNGDIDRYNLSAVTQQQAYEKAQSEKTLQTSEAVKNVAEAKEAGARSVEAIASAGRQNAEARKSRIEADNAGGTEGAMGTPQQLGQMMTDGQVAPSQLSKRSKDYNAALPYANQYSMQKYGVPFDAEIAEGRFKGRSKTIDAFADGKEGDQIQTFNQFLGHAGQLSDQIDKLRNQNISVLNVPINKLRKALGDTRYAQIEPLIMATRTEHANFLNNNHALHEQDITEGHDLLSDDMNLGQMQGAIKAFAGTAIVRTGALNERYRRVVGAGDVPGIFDDNSRRVIRSLGLDKEANQHMGTAWQQPIQTQQNASTPPTPQRQQQQSQQPQTAPASPIQLQPGEVPHVNPQTKQQAVLRNNKWVDVATGKAI